jgi:hypothetical protein
MWQDTHTICFILIDVVREVLNYGVGIKEDIRSTEHTASMEEIYTQIRSKKQKGRDYLIGLGVEGDNIKEKG